jgi:hypothetical protein
MEASSDLKILQRRHSAAITMPRHRSMGFLGLLLSGLWLILPAALQAEDLLTCDQQLQRIRSLSEQALHHEVVLVKAERQRLCPALSREADREQASGDPAQAIDYTALIDCRHRAEAALKAHRPVLHRNREGFAFYTTDGAALARDADALLQAMEARCP